jgi:hypothetical protein
MLVGLQRATTQTLRTCQRDSTTDPIVTFPLRSLSLAVISPLPGQSRLPLRLRHQSSSLKISLCHNRPFRPKLPLARPKTMFLATSYLCT